MRPEPQASALASIAGPFTEPTRRPLQTIYFATCRSMHRLVVLLEAAGMPERKRERDASVPPSFSLTTFRASLVQREGTWVDYEDGSFEPLRLVWQSPAFSSNKSEANVAGDAYSYTSLLISNDLPAFPPLDPAPASFRHVVANRNRNGQQQGPAIGESTCYVLVPKRTMIYKTLYLRAIEIINEATEECRTIWVLCSCRKDL